MMTVSPPTIHNFKPFRKNSLRAFFDVELPSGLTICGCTLHESHGKWWTGLPAKPVASPGNPSAWAEPPRKIVDFANKPAAASFQSIVTPLARELLDEIEQMLA